MFLKTLSSVLKIFFPLLSKAFYNSFFVISYNSSCHKHLANLNIRKRNKKVLMYKIKKTIFIRVWVLVV